MPPTSRTDEHIRRDWQPVFFDLGRARRLLRAAVLLRAVDEDAAADVAFIVDAWFTRATADEPV